MSNTTPETSSTIVATPSDSPVTTPPAATSKLVVTPADVPIKAPIDTQAATSPGQAMHTTASASVTGNWNEQKAKLKSKFPSLTEADLHYDNGKKDEMFARIQDKLGKTKEELTIIISGL